VRTLLRGFNELSDTSESFPSNYPASKNTGGHHPSVDDGPKMPLGYGSLPTITHVQNATWQVPLKALE
jgi:hypothetical protein